MTQTLADLHLRYDGPIPSEQIRAALDGPRPHTLPELRARIRITRRTFYDSNAIRKRTGCAWKPTGLIAHYRDLQRQIVAAREDAEILEHADDLVHGLIMRLQDRPMACKTDAGRYRMRRCIDQLHDARRAVG
jgi:hypothetical protein